MSKSTKRQSREKKSPEHKKIKSLQNQRHQSAQRLLFLVFALILAAIPFSLGKYFEFNSPGPYDSGAYVYSASHILEGARIGVEEKPSAKLGTLLVNILGVRLFGFSETGPKLIQGILQLCALVMMFVAVSRLFGRLAASISVIICSIYLSSPLIAKFGNVKEQYMRAFMVMGISCFALYELGGRRWQAILAGAFLSWAPLFKETGVSAIAAVGLFVLLQPAFKQKSFKQTGIDILLLLSGAVIAIAPLYIWIIGWGVKAGLPYFFVWNITSRVIISLLPAAEKSAATTSYLTTSRSLVNFSEQWPRVLRYYGLLILPVALAMCSIIARWIRMVLYQFGRPGLRNKRPYDRFVLLFGVWWLLDMAFVWISPRSYPQYYLPLNASAAMLGGYAIALYSDTIKSTIHKGRWAVVAAAAVLCMTAMSWHIFFGIETSPHTGINYGEKRRGYAQKLSEISRRKRENLRGGWERAGDYIREHSGPDDKIYVWGWVPGIYVQAQRFSSATQAFCMPRPAPAKLAKTISTMLAEFEKEPPKFIVDTRKLHIPMNRPPYELWPIVPKGFMRNAQAYFLPTEADFVAAFDAKWSDLLSEDEAQRYEILGKFRKFVMDNYEIVEPRWFMTTSDSRKLLHRMFADHILFELKQSPARKVQK